MQNSMLMSISGVVLIVMNLICGAVRRPWRSTGHAASPAQDQTLVLSGLFPAVPDHSGGGPGGPFPHDWMNRQGR